MSAVSRDKISSLRVLSVVWAKERGRVRYGCSGGRSSGTDLLSCSMGFIHRSCCRSSCQLLVVRHMLLPVAYRSRKSWVKTQRFCRVLLISFQIIYYNSTKLFTQPTAEDNENLSSAYKYWEHCVQHCGRCQCHGNPWLFYKVAYLFNMILYGLIRKF